jgi:PAS domain S-box-containing protein
VRFGVDAPVRMVRTFNGVRTRSLQHPGLGATDAAAAEAGLIVSLTPQPGDFQGALLSPSDLGIGRLFWAIRDAVIVADVETGSIVLWSPSAERLFGYAAADVIGQSLEVLMPERMRAPHAIGLAHYRATGHGVLIDASLPVEVLALRKTGEEFDIELSLSPMEDPSRPGRFVLAIVRDATERKRAEQHRLEHERADAAHAEAEAGRQRVAFLAECSRELSSSLDYEVTLARVARLAVPTLADLCAVDIIQEDGVVRRLAVSHADPADVTLNSKAEACSQPEPAATPTVPYLPTEREVLVGEIREVPLSTSVRDPEHLRMLAALGLQSYIIVPLVARGRTLGALTLATAESGRRYDAVDVALAEDLAGRAALAIDNARLYREAQDRSAQLEASMRTRDDFLAAISHDLKNPLTAIKGTAQVLHRLAARGESNPARLLRSLISIEHAAGQMVELLDELLDLAHLQLDRPLDLARQPTDLLALVRPTVSEYQQATERHQFLVDAADTQVIGDWDPVRLERVLDNLLSNAVKYSPAGGDITVQVSRETGSGFAVLTVADQGLGIPVDDLPYVFERFRRGTNVVGQIAGTGIGLAAVRQVVEQHGGRVTVTSQQGHGSTFTVRLPLFAGPDASKFREVPVQHKNSA